MDKDELLRRERIHEVSGLSQHELSKLKFERRQKKNREYYTPVNERPVEKKAKPKGCMVGIIVVDEGGEHVYMWNAPSLRGTMMPTKQNLTGYKEAVFDAFQKAFGKLTENR